MTLGEYTVRAEVLIDHPIEDVWTFVADPENDPQWCPLVSGTAPAEGGVGRRYRYEQRFGPMKREGTIEIVAEEAPLRLELRTLVMGGEFLGTYTLEWVGDGTRFAHTNRVRWSGPMRVLSPVQRRATKRLMDRQLGRLKALLEEAPPR